MAKNGAGKPKEKDLLIRDMPADLLRRVRSRAALEDRTLKAVAVEAFEDYVKKKGG
jgi:hypothetical protein